VVLDEIRSFQPGADVRLGWNGLAALIEEADCGGVLADVAPAVLELFERRPEVWPVFSLWEVVHRLDWVPEAVSAAVAPSLRRRPSAFAAVLAWRLVRRGMCASEGVSLPGLLAELAAGAGLSPAIRRRLARLLAAAEEAGPGSAADRPREGR
jgi:hypothetical protein